MPVKIQRNFSYRVVNLSNPLPQSVADAEKTDQFKYQQMAHII